MNKPFTSSSAEACLKLYLKEAQIDEGETLHNFRSGSAITLAISGSPLACIMSRVGWNNKETALYYVKLAEVLCINSPSHLLSADCSVTSAPKYKQSLSFIVCRLFSDVGSKFSLILIG